MSFSINKRYNKYLKLKYVSIYKSLKKKEKHLSLRSFCKMINDIDEYKDFKLIKLNEATFRGWIKQVDNYSIDILYNITDTYYYRKYRYLEYR